MKTKAGNWLRTRRQLNDFSVKRVERARKFPQMVYKKKRTEETAQSAAEDSERKVSRDSLQNTHPTNKL